MRNMSEATRTVLWNNLEARYHGFLDYRTELSKGRMNITYRQWVTSYVKGI